MSDVKVESIKEQEPTAVDPLLHPKKKERKQLIVIFIVIAVLLAIGSGTLSLFDSSPAPQKLEIDKLHELNQQGKLSPERGYIYGEHSIVQSDGLWWSDVYVLGTLFKTPLHFGPRDVEQITITGEVNSSFNQFPDVYVAINPEVSDKYYTLAISELSVNLAKVINRAPIGSCTKEDDTACIGREIINCADTNGRPVIHLEYQEPASITLQGSCIMITGQGYNITKAVDRLLYRWYGIMT
ncbi:hypothetical protein HY496_03725 [Candidatus Woesearchaeota archaeon]|nr:hypothetical protein [Candidatus Woesearchaeota archaeon]